MLKMSIITHINMCNYYRISKFSLVAFVVIIEHYVAIIS
jgi:hypothetical protein